MRLLVMVALAGASAVTACSGDPPKTAGDYCQTISANLDRLNAPAIADTTAIESTAELYRSITSIAPLAVQEEWRTMTSTVEAAAAVDPNDPASVQSVTDMARQSQHAASAISDYTTRICGVTIVTPTTTTIAAPPEST
ncbi:MAG TPA: hypothetical protein VH761_15235, partial [Ilumatobacteraceae bacterium]